MCVNMQSTWVFEGVLSVRSKNGSVVGHSSSQAVDIECAFVQCKSLDRFFDSNVFSSFLRLRPTSDFV